MIAIVICLILMTFALIFMAGQIDRMINIIEGKERIDFFKYDRYDE